MDPLQDPGTYLKIFLGLGATVFLFLVFGYYLRRFPSSIITGQGKLFRVLAKQALDRSNDFYLIESLGKIYLFYGSIDKLQLIDRFDPSEIEEHLKHFTQEIPLKEIPNFPKLLKTLQPESASNKDLEDQQQLK